MKRPLRRDVLQLAGLGAAGTLLPRLLAGCGDDAANAAVGDASMGDASMAYVAPPFDPDMPWWLQGNYGVLSDERETMELEVEGAIPTALSGLFARNGSNAQSGQSAHWFVGDGMVHGLRIEEGRPLWYRNRWVETQNLVGEPPAEGEPPSLEANDSNVALVHHASKLLSLGEVGLPYQLATEDLGTLGAYDFDGALMTAMTAHPKIDPVTGEMLMFGYNWAPPYLTYHLVDADGVLVRSEVIDIPGPAMMHNFAITESKVVFMDLPIVFDFDEAVAGSGFPYAWDDDYGARMGVMPRDGGNADVQWYDVDPCYVFHLNNAYDDGEAVVLEGARHTSLWQSGPGDFGSQPAMHRWRMDPAAGSAGEEPLDDVPIEFPQVDPRLTGKPYRYSYALRYDIPTPGEGPQLPSGILKYDMRDGSSSSIEMPEGHVPDERVFVPASADAGEDEGYLMGFVYDSTRDESALVIHDAQTMADEPVARVKLPYRVPFGFHGLWVPD